MNSKPSSAVARGRWIKRLVPALAVGALVPVLVGHELASAQPKAATPPAPPATAPQAAATSAPAAPAAAPPERDAIALAALVKMSMYLQSLKSFAVHGETTTDETLLTGQKIQLSSTVDILARRPDRLKVDVLSDRKQRQNFYDGKTLTQYAPRVNYYATIPAPGTIKATLDMVDDKYDVHVPLADLFYWGTEEAPLSNIVSALQIGPAKVGDADCDQYAFRQANADWQVWIERGASPVPRKLVITTLDEPSQPQHTALMRWDVHPKVDDELFVFRPPKDAQKIVFAPAMAAK